MNKKSLFISIIALFAVLFTACKDEDDPAPPAADNRTALTAVAEQTGNSVAADVTAATAQFAGATGLTLAAADFTITPTTGATIGEPTVSDDIVTVPITITESNSESTDKTFTVGIASDSALIKGTDTVTITQAGTEPPADNRAALTAVAEQTGNSVEASVTAATAQFAGATGLTLTAADFTITPTTGATIGTPTVSDGVVTVPITITESNSESTDKTFTVGIASDSTLIKGTDTVTITQAGTSG
ncbi:MAG: hypothetical protein LBQ77_05185 [Treponema sp.]|jgi:hypothetical protein|nr:hypothetical protein [Treponema sp.]